MHQFKIIIFSLSLLPLHIPSSLMQTFDLHSISNKMHTIQKQALMTGNQTIILDVPLVKQNPELKYGCEVTSLTMVLNYAGLKVTKMDLFNQIRLDKDPLVKKRGNILKWGDPSVGFVGDMTGKKAGYAVFDKPMEELVNHYLPNQALNLTNQDFSVLENHVRKGFPIVVWTTGDYRLPDRWEEWEHNGHIIKTPLDLHAVVLVGFNKEYVFLNDPLSGKKNVKVNKKRFIQSWIALKSRAITYQ
ncbi:C39 family peptidase [Niallia sp. 03190]|uniref:C39 family peptidase n=1 Tax=Niallia sp. 03190 TaxID=3458061 RepID=UPI004043E267